jgi:hypothetical protein
MDNVLYSNKLTNLISIMKTTTTYGQWPNFFMRLAALLLVALLSNTTVTKAQTFSEVTVITTYSEFVECQYAGWDVKFKVNTPSPNGGWIVQKVAYKRDATLCPPNSGPHPGNINESYYEAWPVAPNANTSTTTFPPAVPGNSPHNDRYLIIIPNNTIGTGSIIGEVAFIANDSAGTSILDTANTWKFGGVTRAGRLHAVDSVTADDGSKVAYTPPFWQALSASNKITKHEMSISWICCGGGNDTLIVDTLIEGPKVVTPPDEEDTTEVVPPKEEEEPVNPDEQGDIRKRGKDLGSSYAAKHAPEVYPNPLGKGNVLSIAHAEKLAETSIFNLLGERVYRVRLNGKQKEEITLPNLVSGQYILIISNQSGEIYRQQLSIME